MEAQEQPRKAKPILSNKITAEGITAPDCKLSYRTVERKTKLGGGIKTDMLVNRIELKIQT